MQNYLSVKQLSTKYPVFSEASLRFYLFNSQKNQLEKAVRRVGRKILINEDLFIQWIENQNGGAA